MPKIVDHEQRKILIAEATWTVITRDGLEKATVREVAQEAGLSPGALRHYFSTQNELLAYSMKLVSDRVKKRAESKNYEGPRLEVMLELLSEALPMDDERRIEMEVWLIFSSRSLVDKKLHSLSQKVFTEMRHAVRLVIDRLTQLGFIRNSIDPELETRKLHALIDGVGLHALLHPDMLTAQEMTKIIKSHLLSLCNGEEEHA
ncbi:TetR/AcrR family transcriptional regulator [Virgibacillus siamensis]|uniref:TetR/AcrR family transcriptional regulator n=1 Tax=Virgibacillus siamensis TaxID=480071 RepID=A0ABN1G5R5_9BACI